MRPSTASTTPENASATASLDILHQAAFHEQLRSLGFEVIGNGPDGLRKRIEIEVPRYRDLVIKAGIERV